MRVVKLFLKFCITFVSTWLTTVIFREVCTLLYRLILYAIGFYMVLLLNISIKRNLVTVVINLLPHIWMLIYFEIFSLKYVFLLRLIMKPDIIFTFATCTSNDWTEASGLSIILIFNENIFILKSCEFAYNRVKLIISKYRS